MIVWLTIGIILACHILIRSFERAVWLSTAFVTAVVFVWLLVAFVVRQGGGLERIFILLAVSIPIGFLVLVASCCVGYPFLIYRTWRGPVRKYPYGHCRNCGYNLTGNESGVCPECGKSC